MKYGFVLHEVTNYARLLHNSNSSYQYSVMSSVELQVLTQLPINHLYELSVLDLESRVRQSAAAETNDTTGPWELQYPSPGDSSLIQKSLLSFSPNRKFLALVSSRHLLILKSCPGVRDGPYNVSYNIHTQAQPLISADSEDLGDESTDAIALTLLLPPTARNGEGGLLMEGEPILTDVFAVGFSSGFLRVYSDEGVLLFEQLLHEEPVRKLRCFTSCHAVSTNPRVPLSDQESILLLYNTAVLSISGSALAVSCRTTSVSADGANNNHTGLEHRKWRFEDAKDINDVIYLGVVVPSLFDHLQEACVLGGFEQRVRGVATPEEQFLTGGCTPMFGFYLINDQNSLNVSEIVAEVATRVKTAVSAKLSSAGGWLGFGQNEHGASGAKEEVKKKPPRILRSVGLPLNSNISDPPRKISSISLSPRGVLAVATDNFGRVLLLDTRRKVVSRIWKGYRDAQCGWIQCKEEGQGREGLFLAIYAPKRGILEIWPAQSGVRMAAFTIGKGARLLHTPHGILGLGQLIQQQRRVGQITGGYTSPLATTFVLHSSGVVREIIVPFHLTLPPTLVDQAQDEVLLRLFRNTLLRPVFNFPEAQKILLAIESPIHLLSGLHALLRSGTSLLSSDILQVIQQLTDKQKRKLSLEEGGENDNDDVREKRETLLCILKQYSNLTQNVYMLLRPDKDTDSHTPLADNQLIKFNPRPSQERLMLLFDENEEQLNHTLSVLQTYRSVSVARDGLKLVNFLSCFHIKDKAMVLKSSIHEEKRVRLGQFLYDNENSSAEQATQLALIESGISLRDLTFLLLTYWLSGPDITSERIERFSESLRIINSAPSPPDMWEEYRAQCASSYLVGHVLVAVLAGRQLGVSAPVALEDDSPDTWEPVSEEDKHWGHLVDQLQSLISIYSIWGSVSSWSVRLSAREQSCFCRHYLSDKAASYLNCVKLPVECLVACDGENEKSDVMTSLNLVRDKFPLCLSSDLLLAHSIAQSFTDWKLNRNTSCMLRAVHALLYVQSLPLRQGLCVLCWEQYVLEQMEALVQMVEKVGRCPSEKNLLKTLGMNLDSVRQFVSQTKSLLEILQKTMKKIHTNSELLSEEEMQEDFPIEISLCLPSDPSAFCLIDTVLTQKPPTLRACERLYTLLCCLEYVVSLNFRSVRPLSLITSRELLREFKLRVGQEIRPFTEIQKERERFLSHIISHHADPIHLSLDSASLDKLYSLSDLLSIDPEQTRANIVVSLYASNQDDRGEEILLTLTDRDVISEDLVTVLGLRLGSLIFSKTSSQHSTYLLSQLPTLASKWVEGLWERRYDSQLLVSPDQKQTLDCIKRLCETIKGILSAQSKHKELITNLSTALEYLFLLS